MSTVAERVAAGIAFLDENQPGWDQRIDLPNLRMEDSCRCVLGQVYSALAAADECGCENGFEYACEHIGIRDEALGFDKHWEEGYDAYDALNALWTRVIEERRAVTP